MLLVLLLQTLAQLAEVLHILWFRKHHVDIGLRLRRIVLRVELLHNLLPFSCCESTDLLGARWFLQSHKLHLQCHVFTLRDT